MEVRRKFEARSEIVGPEKALICLYCYIITAEIQLFSTKKAFSDRLTRSLLSGRARRKASRHLFAAAALAALFAGVLPEKVDFDFFRFD
jgi:hypothetical protein